MELFCLSQPQPLTVPQATSLLPGSLAAAVLSSRTPYSNTQEYTRSHLIPVHTHTYRCASGTKDNRNVNTFHA